MKDPRFESYLDVYQSPPDSLSKLQLIDLIQREARFKYPHLKPRLFPDGSMQAKITIFSAKQSLLNGIPNAYIQVLKSESFVQDKYYSESVGNLDTKQFVLANDHLKQIGIEFSIVASFSASSISVWFRNKSKSPRSDIAVFYALEILNRIDNKCNNTNFIDSTGEVGKDSSLTNSKYAGT